MKRLIYSILGSNKLFSVGLYCMTTVLIILSFEWKEPSIPYITGGVSFVNMIFNFFDYPRYKKYNND